MQRLAITVRSLAALLLLICSATPAAGGITPSDEDLLQQIEKANESNLRQIHTWSGTADISDKFLMPDRPQHAGVDLQMDSVAYFTVDSDKDMKRWQWKVMKAESRSASGTLTPAPEQVDTTDEMLLPDGYFVLQNGFRPVGSTQWQRSLVIRPRSEARNPAWQFSRTFDPFSYTYVQGKPLRAFIEQGRPSWSTMVGGTLKSVRKGSIVEFQCTSDTTHTLIESWSVDLDCGANAVGYFNDGAGHPTTVSIT
jgi:hypothetical protein